MTNGPYVKPPYKESHSGGEKLFSGRIRPPEPTHCPVKSGAVSSCSHAGSTITSSSIKANTSASLCSMAELRAFDFPGRGSKRYRKRLGYLCEKEATTSGVLSLELLSTTRTSQSIES